MHSTYTHGKRRREEKNAKSDVFFFLPLRFVSFALVHLFAWFLITVWAHLNKPENIYRLIECWIKCNYFIVPTIRFCLSLSLSLDKLLFFCHYTYISIYTYMRVLSRSFAFLMYFDVLFFLALDFTFFFYFLRSL